MSNRVQTTRQTTPRRKPWHVDYLHTRTLARDVIAHAGHLRGAVLDVGCGNRPYAPYFYAANSYTGIDVMPRGADLVGSALALPFADASFDAAFSAQTLEHVEEPQCMVAELARVLRPGGTLVLTAPQAWRLHEQPYDFFRYTRYGLTHLLTSNGFDIDHIHAQGGAWMTAGQVINNALHARFGNQVYLVYGCYLLSNTLFGALDEWLPDEAETINWIALAHKAPAATITL